MNTIVILPDQSDDELTRFSAVTAEYQATGRTPGEALDALTAQSKAVSSASPVIVQQFRPDQFFSEPKRNRLSELMSHWRKAREMKTSVSTEEQAELEGLVDEEVLGASERSTFIRRDFEMAHACELLTTKNLLSKYYSSLVVPVLLIILSIVALLLPLRPIAITVVLALFVLGTLANTLIWFLNLRTIEVQFGFLENRRRSREDLPIAKSFESTRSGRLE